MLSSSHFFDSTSSNFRFPSPAVLSSATHAGMVVVDILKGGCCDISGEMGGVGDEGSQLGTTTADQAEERL